MACRGLEYLIVPIIPFPSLVWRDLATLSHDVHISDFLVRQNRMQIILPNGVAAILNRWMQKRRAEGKSKPQEDQEVDHG